MFMYSGKGEVQFITQLVDTISKDDPAELAKYLEDCNPSKVKNSSGVNLLQISARKNAMKCFEYLMKQGGFRVDEQLVLAVRRGEVGAIKLLLANGADVRVRWRGKGLFDLCDKLYSSEPIIHSLLDGMSQTMSVEQMAQVFAEDDVPLYCAVYSENAELARTVRENGADPNRPDRNGLTALHAAIHRRDVSLVEYLLSRGADLHVPVRGRHWRKNLTILQWLVSEAMTYYVKSDESHEESWKTIVRLLVRNGADPYVVDDNGNNLLHLVAWNFAGRTFCPVVLRQLLDIGVLGVNVKNVDGDPPLYMAFKFNTCETIELLLERGADWNILNFNFLKSKAPFEYLSGGHIYCQLHREQVLMWLLKYEEEESNLSVQDSSVAYISGDPEYLEFVVKWIAMLEQLDRPISQKMKQFVKSKCKLSRLIQKYRRELTKSRARKVYGTISFFDVMVGKVNTVARYANNEEFVQALRVVDCNIAFPEYGFMIGKNFAQGMERRRLLANAVEKLKDFPLFRIPDIVKDHILDHLSIDDLRSICDL